jgi:NifU-like protein involved in Fe-S cluster formation
MADPYSTEILKLAAEIPHLGRLTKPDASARKVSRICGSAIDVDLVVEDGRIADAGLEVNACALGQAAASVFARDAIGADLVEVASARDALKAMLKTGGPPPEGRFAGLAALEGARDYPARHGSIMLAFEAAAAALEDAAEKPRA